MKTDKPIQYKYEGDSHGTVPELDRRFKIDQNLNFLTLTY